MINFYIGEVIKVVFGFNVIVVINEGYVGILLMNEVLKNRFIVIEVDYIDGDIFKIVIKE